MSLSSSQEEQRFGYVRYVARSLAVASGIAGLLSNPNDVYKPLDLTKNEIRILRLLPQNNGGIECTLFHASLNDEPNYEALSYVWNESPWEGPYPPNHITLNGYLFPVTKNLSAALSNLRFPSTERLLWADAICINQQNIPERNEQVKKMTEIYRLASAVISWLGPASQDSQMAFALFDKLNRQQLLYDGVSKHDEISRLIVRPNIEPALRAVQNLASRPYWTRAWVVQEVAMARQGIIACGEISMSWKDFTDAGDKINVREMALREVEARDLSIKLFLFCPPMHCRLNLSPSQDSRGGLSLLDLVAAHSSKNATDPRDKIYAFVGLSSPGEIDFPIDYSKPVREVYTDFVRYMVKLTADLEIITWQERDKRSDLPSWVPDWSMNHSHLWDYSSFTAAKNSKPMICFRNDDRALFVKGLCIDTIETISEPSRMNPFSSEPQNISNVIQDFHSWREFLRQKTEDSIGIGEADIEEAMMATFLATSLPDASYLRHGLGAVARMTLYGLKRSNRDTILLEDVWKALPEDALDGDLFMLDRMAAMTCDRRFMISSRWKYIGLVEQVAREGDLICILFGCNIPVILRPRGEQFILIGAAYIYSYMRGRAMDELDAGLHQLRDFEIV